MLVLKWSVAPLVILVTFVGYLKINEPEVSNEFLADVSNQEIIDYLESTGINETELIALIDQTNLDLTADPLDHVDLGEENLEDLIDEFNLDSDYL